jgi:hypothetical protein
VNTRALLVALALSSSIAACNRRHGEHGPPAVWEPIDEEFKGCEGG